VLVGAERHDTVDLALRYLGLGRPTPVAADDQGRIRVDELAQALAQVPNGEPVIVCLQAGNVHSGSFDPFAAAIEVAHSRGAWVHVDGAFGLWAAACPELQHLVGGLAGADSWGTDAHKTLNVPYDCGLAIVADPTALRSAFGGTLLLGLEVLVAADLLRTVAVAPTLDNVLVLGLIVLIRTVLSFSLETEIEGVAPWRRAQMSGVGGIRQATALALKPGPGPGP